MPSTAQCLSVSPSCPVSATTYGYYPNFGGNVFFAVIYGIMGVAQLGLGVYFRSWTFMIAVCVGAFMEMAGYIGRILMNNNPWDQGAFKLQIVCLVLAPTFVAAGIYLTLKHIILNLGPEHSPLKPRLFTWIFISCDVGSLILQAAGGGVTSSGSNKGDVHMTDVGNDIIIAGIVFQVVTMAACGLVSLKFFWALFHRPEGFSGEKSLEGDGPSTVSSNVHYIVAAEIAAYFFVLIRCIYRIPEMAGGWGSPLMQKEDEFLVLDGMMIALGCLALTVCHPGFYFTSIRTGYKN